VAEQLRATPADGSATGIANLIYDVGLHVGTDTAYYLHRGYDVVAVEANPILAAEAEQRFAAEIAAGRLKVVNVGIGEGEGEATFWVCDDWTAWSSFDQSVASRNGKRHHAETVRVMPLAQVFAEHGMPHYCKVDIEGHDKYALDEMRADHRPAYLSVELSEHPFLDRMEALGYDRFKFVHQLSFTPMSAGWEKVRALAPHAKLRAGLERGRGLLRGTLNDGRWWFRIGSSGPLPFDVPGRWLTLDEARREREWITGQFDSGRFTLLDSFDLHATTQDALKSS
jgi:FkbM family methyltransferase